MLYNIFDITNYLAEASSYGAPASAEKIAEHFSEKEKTSPNEIDECIAKYVDRAVIPGTAIRKKDGGYYIEMPFSESDTAILKCAVTGLPYCEKWQLAEIDKRLDYFLPFNMRSDDNIKFLADKYPGTFYKNISEIIKALHPQNGEENAQTMALEFEYCVYDENLELVPKLSHDGDLVRTVNPLKMICVKNLFYLVTFYIDDNSDKIKYINYRIDKMKNVKCTDTPSLRYSDYISDEEKYYLQLKRTISRETEQARKKGKIYEGSGADPVAADAASRMDRNGFNISDYLHRSFIMYTDKKIESVKVRTAQKFIGGIIDAFGFDIDIVTEKNDIITVTLYDVSETTVLKWALQYSNEIEILTPKELRKRMIDIANSVIQKYGRNQD